MAKRSLEDQRRLRKDRIDALIIGPASISEGDGDTAYFDELSHQGRTIIISQQSGDGRPTRESGERFLRIQPDDLTRVRGGLSTNIRLNRPLGTIPVRLVLKMLRAGARHALPMFGDPQAGKTNLLFYLVRRVTRAVIGRGVNRIDGVEYRLRASPARRVIRAASKTLRRVAGMRGLQTADLAVKGGHASQSNGTSRRVLIFNSALAWGGAERQIVNTMTGLAQRDVDACLALEQLGYVPDSYFFAPALDHLSLPYAPLSHWARGEQQMSNEDRSQLQELLEHALSLPEPFCGSLAPYLSAIVSVRPEIVHAWQDQTAVMAGVAAVLAGVPRVVLSTRNVAAIHFAFHQPHMREAYQALAGDSRVHLLNNSAAGAASYEQWLDLPEGTFTVLRNGFDLGRFDPANKLTRPAILNEVPKGAPLVGSVFRFFKEKDPLLWLETAKVISIKRPDAHFIIAGTGPMLDTVRQRAQALGLAERLYLPGAVEQPEVLVRHLDAFLLTSQFEGLPNVLIEAQASGVPVVSTIAGGSAETFRHGETGFLVETREPSDLAQATLRILDDPDWSARARLAAVQLARDRFGLDRMIDETLAVYGLRS